MDACDARRVVPVAFPALLDFALHRAIDHASIHFREVRSVLIVLATTGNGRPASEPGGLDIAGLSAIALAIPEVLLVLGIGVFEDGQPAESLSRQVFPPKATAATGFHMTGVEFVDIDLYTIPQMQRHS